MKEQRVGKFSRCLLVICAVFMVFLCTACSDEAINQVKDQVTKKKDEVSQNIQKEAKEAVISQIEDFFRDTDFMESFGISDEEKDKLEEQIEGVVNDYQFDISNMKDLQEQLDSIFDSDTIAEKENQDNQKMKEVMDELEKQIMSIVE